MTLTVTGRTMQLIRNEIIEECAKVCDAKAALFQDWSVSHGVAAELARAIRTLAVPLQEVQL